MSNLAECPVIYERSAASIATFVEGLAGKVESFEGDERRSDVRYVVAIPSIVQPLDEQQYTPQGRAFTAVTRDISTGGIGLVHSQPVTAKFLGVRLSPLDGPQVRFLVKVLRCQPLGAYFDIAGQFVTSSESSADANQGRHPGSR